MSTEVTCAFCGEKGDFFADDFRQVVMRFENGTDWQGDFALACYMCSIRYRRGRVLVTEDGRTGITPEETDRVATCFKHANEDPLFKVYLLGKPHYGEGQRWVKTDETRELEKQIRQKLEEEFKSRTGKTIAQWENEQQEKQVREGRIPACFAGKWFTKTIEE